MNSTTVPATAPQVTAAATAGVLPPENSGSDKQQREESQVAASMEASPAPSPISKRKPQSPRSDTSDKQDGPTIRLTGVQTPVSSEAVSPRQLQQMSSAPEPLPTPAAARDMPQESTAGVALSLGDALATGLTQNPDLITVRGTANVSAAAVDVARVYPWNPFVQGQFFPNGSPFINTPGNVSGKSNYYVWLMQRFELGHQRQHREESAAAAFGQVRWNIRQAELLNIAQTERLFFLALYQQQTRNLAADSATLSDRLFGVVDRRVKAGLATNLELANAQVAVRQSRRQSHLAEASYQAALLNLRQQLGLPSDAPLNLEGDPTKYHWLPVADVVHGVTCLESLEPQHWAMELAEARPDVMAARSGTSITRANLNLARAARTPDVQAGPILDTADDGTKFLGVRLQRDFFVFNDGSALANQRQNELRQQVLAYEQLKRRATNEAAAAIDRYERARQFAADAAQEISESPPVELEQVVAQYEAGKADIINVLAIQNNLLQDFRSYLDLANEVAQSAAMLTQTTGLPPERLLAPPPPKHPPSAAPEMDHN